MLNSVFNIKMAFVSVFQVLSIGLFCLFLVGILNVTFTDQENHCEMTFMFEYPQFVVSLFLYVTLAVVAINNHSLIEKTFLKYH